MRLELPCAGENATFGEVALVEVDSVRTATVVADNHIDLLTIDRDLFNRCLRGVVAEDMQVSVHVTCGTFINTLMR